VSPSRNTVDSDIFLSLVIDSRSGFARILDTTHDVVAFGKFFGLAREFSIFIDTIIDQE
jgi:hypothetical protein